MFASLISDLLNIDYLIHNVWLLAGHRVSHLDVH